MKKIITISCNGLDDPKAYTTLMKLLNNYPSFSKTYIRNKKWECNCIKYRKNGNNYVIKRKFL